MPCPAWSAHPSRFPTRLRMKAPKSIRSMSASNPRDDHLSIGQHVATHRAQTGRKRPTERMARRARIDTRHHCRPILEHTLGLKGDPIPLKRTILGIVLQRQCGRELFNTLDESAVGEGREFGEFLRDIVDTCSGLESGAVGGGGFLIGAALGEGNKTEPGGFKRLER